MLRACRRRSATPPRSSDELVGSSGCASASLSALAYFSHMWRVLAEVARACFGNEDAAFVNQLPPLLRVALRSTFRPYGSAHRDSSRSVSLLLSSRMKVDEQRCTGNARCLPDMDTQVVTDAVPPEPPDDKRNDTVGSADAVMLTDEHADSA